MQQTVFIEIALTLVMLAGPALAERHSPVVGAEEGTEFVARCPRLSNLVGVELYSRDDIDAVRPICADAYSPTTIGEPVPVVDPVGGRADGANLTVLRCPPEAPIVIGAHLIAEKAHTSGLNGIRLECGLAGANSAQTRREGAVFDAPAYRSTWHEEVEGDVGCLRSFGTYVAVGLHGWSAGDWVHALGFICDDPATTAKTVGRTKKPPVGLAAGAKPGPSFGATSYCESYSAAAVSAAIENRNLGCRGEGGRWTSEYDRHFNWCMGLGGDRTVSNQEAVARAKALDACRKAKGK